jgi:hypothetical protein
LVWKAVILLLAVNHYPILLLEYNRISLLFDEREISEYRWGNLMGTRSLFMWSIEGCGDGRVSRARSRDYCQSEGYRAPAALAVNYTLCRGA